VLLGKGRAGEWYDHPDFDIWAAGNEWTVEAECSLLVLPLGTAPGDIKEDFLVLRALKRERCWPFAGSQDRVPLVVCLVFHRWPGHGDVKEDSLVVRTLKRDCRRLFCVEFSEEKHAGCLFYGALKRGSRCLFSGLHSQARGAPMEFVRH
jgi:hypothetical protein